VDAFMCYKQKCKLVSLNLAHPVYVLQLIKNYNAFVVLQFSLCSTIRESPKTPTNTYKYTYVSIHTEYIETTLMTITVNQQLMTTQVEINTNHHAKIRFSTSTITD